MAIACRGPFPNKASTLHTSILFLLTESLDLHVLHNKVQKVWFILQCCCITEQQNVARQNILQIQQGSLIDKENTQVLTVFFQLLFNKFFSKNLNVNCLTYKSCQRTVRDSRGKFYLDYVFIIFNLINLNKFFLNNM